MMMTNIEAIEYGKEQLEIFGGQHAEFIRMAIEALEGKDIDVPSRKGVFIPDITVEMFRNASLEGVEELMASGVMEDVSLPSAQPEIIRCKDCKYYVIHTLFGRSQGWCERLCDEFDRSLARGTEPDDFCSRAERRSDETD